jgi:hypothetical protein
VSTDDAAQELATLRRRLEVMAAAWEEQLPETVQTATVVEALRLTVARPASRSGLVAEQRVRAYLAEFPDTANLGPEIAYGPAWNTPGWPHDFYPLTRADVDAVLAELASTRAEAEVLYEARLNEPVLRHCVYPGCLAEFDMAAALAGRPTRPSWSGDGWLTVGHLFAHVCPEHAPLLRTGDGPGPHLPQWERGEETRLVCACAWRSGPVRWRGFGIEAWKDHLLAVEQGAAPWPS